MAKRAFSSTIEAKLSAPDTQAGWLQRLMLTRLRAHEAAGEIPTSVRFLYYEVKDQLPERPKSHRRLWSQDISDALMDLRKARLVPWWWLDDEVRSLTEWESSPSVYAYARNGSGATWRGCCGGRRGPRHTAVTVPGAWPINPTY